MRLTPRVALLACAFLLTACDARVTPPAPGPTGYTPPPGIRSDYLALGDSYTIGQSVPAEERFPNQLADTLRSQGIDVGQPTIIARTGWTTADLLNALDRDGALGGRTAFPLVTLLIGVNDQYQGLSVEVYAEHLKTLLGRAIAFAQGDPQRVIVVSIPDYGVTPFGQSMNPTAIAEQLDAFNTRNRALSVAAGVRYVDIIDLSRVGREDPALYASDGLHPSGLQYRRWVERLLLPASEALRNSSVTPEPAPR